MGIRIGIGSLKIGQGSTGVDWSSYWATHDLNLVVEGHSFATTGRNPVKNLLERIPDLFAYDESGSSVAGIVARAAETNAKIIEGDHNVLIVWIGTNDITNTEGTGLSTYIALKNYIEDEILEDWDRIFVYTCTPSTVAGKDENFEAERDVFNGKLRDELSLLPKVVILDTDTCSELLDSTDELYFRDLVHLTWLGGDIAADLFYDAFEALYTLAPILPEEVYVPINMEVESVGDGTGVVRLAMWVDKNITLTLDGNAKFYSDSGGTTDESSEWLFEPHRNTNYVYIKCTSGTSNLVFDNNNIRCWGEHSGGGDGWTAGTNLPSINGDVSQFIKTTIISLLGANKLTGSVTGLPLTRILLGGNNTLSGNITSDIIAIALTGGSTVQYDLTGNILLQSINVTSGSTYIYGDISDAVDISYLNVRISNGIGGSIANKTKLTYLYLVASSTVYGDIGGIGTAAVVNGMTTLILNACGTITYTSGATWSNTTVQILNSLTQTIISNMLIDMATAGPTSKAINFNNANNDSMADTTQGGIWGDFDGETTPSTLATALKTLAVTRSCTVALYGITLPGGTGDGTGFPAGFGDWYRS